MSKESLVPIFLHIYSLKGFINFRINWILNQKFTNKSNLNGFLVIFLGVMKFDGINKFFEFFFTKNLIFEDPDTKRKSIKLYKSIKVDDNAINELKEKIQNERDRYFLKISKNFFKNKDDRFQQISSNIEFYEEREELEKIHKTGIILYL